MYIKRRIAVELNIKWSYLCLLNIYKDSSRFIHDKMDVYYFSVVDYAVFAAMLILSALTGLYYGCGSKYCKNEEGQTLREYLTGNKNLKAIPVSLSLIASYVSGVTILGSPAEIYNFGTQYWLIVVSIWLSGLAVAFVYVPVFCKLQVNSSYEYLELRFNRYVRTVASVFFVLDEVMFLPIIIYVPSLAFNQVTGADIHLIGTIVTVICIFYTLLGGLKAVVWSDTWQVMAMFISVLVVVILGSYSIGGASAIININNKGKRIEFFNFTPSMYERYTFFSVLVGGFTFWTSFNSVNQTMVQRYVSLPNVKQSKISVALFTVGVSLFVSICCYSGILVYAVYSSCDPHSAGRIKSDDQLLPLFVMETAGHLRGVPGLFIAGVFGAGLSSLSVVLNSTAQVVLEDFVKGCLRKDLTEKTSMIIVKTVVLGLGIVAVGFLYVVEHMGGVLAMATSLSAIAAGTTFGVFTLGMLVPWANSYGAVCGAIAGALMAGLVSFGTQSVAAAKLVVPHKLPVSVDGCYDKYGIGTNATIIEYPDESNIFSLFRLSYLWITPIGVSTVLFVGISVSFLTGKTNISSLDPDVISPVCQWMLPADSHRLAGTAIRKIREKQSIESEQMMPEYSVAVVEASSFPDFVT
ncbi:sodium-coupled monocarboxylate transporter 1-like isoform X2 [Cylas formicarius]|uniref:sodium-coupled monocarboxylate transporter 1-like isoform X2 n=1 Tax=Cylas formicarius TaxID=197179 RepID=UPI00295854A3|nr:sodium-coupled monocarboxylate transporter 1-like isoform X2 [Cylas formicarius]